MTAIFSLSWVPLANMLTHVCYFSILGWVNDALGNVPVAPLNYTYLANTSGLDRPIVEACVREVLTALNRHVADNRDVTLVFEAIGQLAIHRRRIQFNFFQEFEQNPVMLVNRRLFFPFLSFGLLETSVFYVCFSALWFFALTLHLSVIYLWEDILGNRDPFLQIRSFSHSFSPTFIILSLLSLYLYGSLTFLYVCCSFSSCPFSLWFPLSSLPLRA